MEVKAKLFSLHIPTPLSATLTLGDTKEKQGLSKEVFKKAIRKSIMHSRGVGTR